MVTRLHCQKNYSSIVLRDGTSNTPQNLDNTYTIEESPSSREPLSVDMVPTTTSMVVGMRNLVMLEHVRILHVYRSRRV